MPGLYPSIVVPSMLMNSSAPLHRPTDACLPCLRASHTDWPSLPRKATDMAERAIPNSPRQLPALSVGLLAAGFLLGLAACDTREADDQAPAGVAAASPAGTAGARASVAQLVELLQPIDPTLTSDKQDAIFVEQITLQSELREGDREVGLEALRVLREKGSEVVNIERALLEVAAYAAPEDTLPLLVTLVEEYGPALYLRAEAARLIGETSPERALEVLEPWLRKTKPGQTMPPMEFLVMGYVAACERTGQSPVDVLADVATNLFMEESARHMAVRELGKHDEPLAQQALRAILTESTGNAYMRRRAVQGLVKLMPREEACTLFAQIANREADLNFARFLADVLDKNCR